MLVAGAGIAGLTAALALAQRGHRVHVFDRRDDLEEAGAGIQLSPNASRVLIGLGLAPALAPLAVAPARLDIRRAGEPRSHAGMPMNDEASLFGAPFWVVTRQDLHGVLLAAAHAHPAITVENGWALTALRDEAPAPCQVTVMDRHGHTREVPAAALLCCDGLWSAGRRLLGDASAPRFTGAEAWRTLVPATCMPAFARAPAVNLWLGHGWHVVHYPVAAGAYVNLVFIRDNGEARAGWSEPADPADMQRLLTGACPTLRQLVAAVETCRIWSLYDRPETRRHVRGRVALMGDAAHPMLPYLAQGGAMAIEDAAVLAAVMPAPAALAPEGIRLALLRYQGLRQARTARVQAKARQNALIYHANPLLAFARDAALSRISPRAFLARYEWLYGWQPPESAP